jgi:hypothetical protein
MFLFLIKLTLFSLFHRALTVQDGNLQSGPLFSLIDSFSTLNKKLFLFKVVEIEIRFLSNSFSPVGLLLADNLMIAAHSLVLYKA